MISSFCSRSTVSHCIQLYSYLSSCIRLYLLYPAVSHRISSPQKRDMAKNNSRGGLAYRFGGGSIYGPYTLLFIVVVWFVPV